MEEILYSLRNYAYIESHLLDVGDEHMRHMIADICEEGNVDRVRAIVEIAQEEAQKLSDGASEAVVKEYVVCRTMADWLGIVAPQLEVKWREKTKAAALRLRGWKVRKPFRRRLPAF